jgi:hypothetical protein
MHSNITEIAFEIKFDIAKKNRSIKDLMELHEEIKYALHTKKLSDLQDQIKEEQIKILKTEQILENLIGDSSTEENCYYALKKIDELAGKGIDPKIIYNYEDKITSKLAFIIVEKENFEQFDKYLKFKNQNQPKTIRKIVSENLNNLYENVFKNLDNKEISNHFEILNLIISGQLDEISKFDSINYIKIINSIDTLCHEILGHTLTNTLLKLSAKYIIFQDNFNNINKKTLTQISPNKLEEVLTLLSGPAMSIAYSIYISYNTKNMFNKNQKNIY